MDRVRFATFVAIALIAPLVPTAAQATPVADPTDGAGRTGKATPASDVRELDRTRFTLDGRPLPEKRRYQPRKAPQSRAATAGTPAVGTTREWLGLDDVKGKYYRKNYKLRAVGEHIEVWIAEDIAFPAKDCRKNAVEITDAQITELVQDFDKTIYPKETSAFSTPPDRNGAEAAMDGDFTGDGDKTVTLIDNIRDPNYFDFPTSVTYVAGFFSQQLNELFDRNVMTIDAYDWKHRFGADPADDPTEDLCSSRPARPRLYEGTFAHEWQHLLEYYADPDEETWVNEGLSDYAQTLVGYVDGRATVYQHGVDSHLSCFQGFGPVKTKFNANPRACGGPQNSLTLWDEGAPSDVLADYGIVYQFMLYLNDRFGPEIISLLHRDASRNGLAGIQAALPTGTPLYDVVHDFQLMTLVDKFVDDGGRIDGLPADRASSASVRSTVNLANKTAYDTPGAAPNGADYVPLPTPLRSVEFRGAKNLPPLPTGWTVAEDTLFSGNTEGLDSVAVRPITVPAKNARLRLETSYAIEDSYDWAYVTVSTDGGRTYTPVAGDRTTAGPLGAGLTGTSGEVVMAGYDLSAYAGKKVLLGLKYVTDSAVHRGGWRIGGITLGGQKISDGSTLDGWKSPSQLIPTPVYNWHVTLVGIDGNRVKVVPTEKFAALKDYPKVVAVVAYDEPTETAAQYAPYTLTVNNKVQPGGGTMP
ncbi:peptidase M6 immune inhibitor A [Micromonosporaceae bacterium Da 78-11]